MAYPKRVVNDAVDRARNGESVRQVSDATCKPKVPAYINTDNIVLVEDGGWAVHMIDGKVLHINYDSRMRLARVLGIEVNE